MLVQSAQKEVNGRGEGLILRHGNTNDEMKPEKTNEIQKIKEQRVGQNELKK